MIWTPPEDDPHWARIVGRKDDMVHLWMPDGGMAWVPETEVQPIPPPVIDTGVAGRGVEVPGMAWVNYDDLNVTVTRSTEDGQLVVYVNALDEDGRVRVRVKEAARDTVLWEGEVL